jgi:hypothetical protein
MLPKSVQSEGENQPMRELKLSVPTYYGTAHCKNNVLSDDEFDAPNVAVLIHEAEGVRIVLGTDDFDDREKPDIQIERRPKGWAIFLHPTAGDPCGCVYFLDDGRSFLLPESGSGSRSIEVLCDREEPAEIDEIDLPEPEIRGVKAPNPHGDEIGVQPTSDGDAQLREQKLCSRCGQLVESCDDWFGDLCPTCADRTDGDWVCRTCGQSGSFEDMGGDGAVGPECCGVPCKRVGDEGIEDAASS